MFVNGVESFDGTVKDTTTWHEHLLNPGPSHISQNDNVTLDFDGSEYVTKTLTAAVAEPVSVELLSISESSKPFAGKSASLYLTTNTKDYDKGIYFDSHYIYIEYNYSFDHYHFIAGYGGDGHGTGQWFGTDTPAPISESPYRLQIERTSSDSAYFSAYYSNGDLIDGTTLNFSGIPTDLHIGLRTGAGFSATFDNVRIVPEPGTILLLGLGTFFIRTKRKKSQ